MYPFIRLFKTIIQAFLSDRVPPDGIGEISFRSRPWDIDIFLEVNNGRILTLYDLGRIDFVIRSGLAGILKKKKWGLVVAGSTVQYRKRIKMFDKVTMRTHVAGFEGRWIYIVQSMWVKGQPASSVLLRTGVTSNGRVVSVEELSRALDMALWTYDANGWIDGWIRCEEKRPWPPE